MEAARGIPRMLKMAQISFLMGVAGSGDATTSPLSCPRVSRPERI
jgi:hypothetical protein